MRVWGRLFLFLIGVFASGCVPPDANTNTSANFFVSSSPGASNTSNANDSNLNAAANVNTNSNANTNLSLNTNLNANTNADAPINYTQPQASNTTNQIQTPPVMSGDAEIVSVTPLIIPVTGVRKEDLRNTFDDARSEGRSHDALDIMAAQGTPVVAAADGEIAQFHDSERGGITIYQYSRDKKLIYYYAHLQKRADNLKKGDFVRQGTVIGTVGDTGNSGAGNFHLHFAVWAITDPKRIWEGTNINPYPLLTKTR